MRRGKNYGRSGFKRFLWLSFLSLILILTIAGVCYWQREAITDWIYHTAAGITQLFGWGLILTVLIFLIFAAFIATRPIALLYYWNKWIGLIMLFAAVWGLLAFFPGGGVLEGYSLGGKIGLSIIGKSAITGVLIVLALMVFGLFMVIPRAFCRAIYRFFCWLGERFKKEPAGEIPVPSPDPGTVKRGSEIGQAQSLYPRYRSAEVKPPTAKRTPESGHSSGNWLWNRLRMKNENPPESAQTTIEATAEQVSEQVDTAPIEDKTPAEGKVEGGSGETKTAESQKDLKQAAQEVWKKYGESPALVTADGWKLPPIEILDNTPEVEFSQADNLKKAKLIEEALASYGVEGKVVQINVGPTVTQFGVEPGWDRKLKEIKEKDKNGDIRIKVEEVSKTRVKVERITSLANDLALALAAPSIRIEAPVPGKSVVGIEVPNTTIGTVSLRSVVESNVFQKLQAKAKLAMALGKGAGGESVVGDLTKMPHLLIAGATGSGKTVCIHSIICCLLLHNTPSDLRFIMIDPKRVEMTSYNSLPHLATPVIVDTNKALGALRWLSQEMDKRYQTMAAARARNIEAYNKVRSSERLPYLVLIIDELADLMMTAGEEVEHTLCRLAQLARATGIHLIVATQRPSVDVVTGLIKANFPSRISFAVTSQVDSRTILDSGGAEKLLGRGDMLYMPTEAAKPKRLQGCFVSDAEIERIVYFWNNQRKETASQLKLDDIIASEVARAEKAPEDPLLEEARKLAQQHGHISASFLQRHLRIGYPRAARLMEQLEDGEDADDAVSGEDKEKDWQ